MLPTFPPELTAGHLHQLQSGLRRLVAPNPSALTGPGTNSYILGEGRVAIIDPGPNDPRHLAALLEATKGEVVEVILLTHAHADHSALTPALKAATGAPVLAFGTAADGLSPHLADLDLGGGEGHDDTFAPDTRLKDGETIQGRDWSLIARHTPGHLGNHMCFLWGEDIFSGDQAMGWATSVVSPPEGDMTAYMASLEVLRSLAPRHLYPGHGAEVIDGTARIEELIAHRLGREAQILTALRAATGTARALAERIYAEVNPALLPAATRNVLSHLLDLEHKGRVKSQDGSRIQGVWELS